jgi:hypothetical protein
MHPAKLIAMYDFIASEGGRAGLSLNWNGFIFYGHNSDDLAGLWSSVVQQNGNGNPLKYPPLRVD